MTITDRLEYLRQEIRAERISYGEIAELQSLAPHIHPSDVELLEWAGVPEKTTTWNVLVPVVLLVDAKTQTEAETIARKQVQDACNAFGDVYDLGEGIQSFESEK